MDQLNIKNDNSNNTTPNLSPNTSFNEDAQ